MPCPCLVAPPQHPPPPPRFQEHDLEVVAVAFSHDDRLLATIGNEL
jgi:hypothetical protein